MRRTLASLLMTFANVTIALAVTCWWLDHTVLDPTRSANVSGAVLATTGVQEQLADAISDAIATELGQDPDTVALIVDDAAQTAGGAALLSDVVVQSHAVLIGAARGPVTIDPATLAALLGDDRALALPPVEIPVPTIGVLDSLRRAVDSLVPALAVTGVTLGALAVLLHPERHRVLRRWGVGLLAVAAGVIVLGYVIPVMVVPSLTSSPWVQAMPSVAREQMGLLFGTSLVATGAGLGLLAISAVLGRGRGPQGWPDQQPAPQRQPVTYGARRR